MKRVRSVIVFLILIAILGGLGYVAYYGIGEERSGSVRSIDLGLDLAGGVSITYQVVGEQTPSQVDIDDTIYKLQKRVDEYSPEAHVYQEGTNRIDIEIPGVSDADQILQELGQPGNLYFIAQTDADGNDNYGYGLTEDGELAYVLYDKTIEDLQADGSIVLSGEDVESAEAASQSTGTAGNSEWVVELAFTPDGTQKFADATTKAYNNGETIGIYYDGAFVSVPTVNEPILGGRAVITGMSTVQAAQQLATTIRIGGLKLQLEELRSNVVGAQLGSDAIHTSMIAAIVGFSLVVLFMIAMFRVLGVAASIALMFYCALMVILLDSFEVTLTLPGIAGIILSIGMAVDANVLVFARIREEIAAGKGVRAAMTGGYQKAFSAILDGNITTLIAALVLWFFGTGTVKGFAQTLGYGIVISMISALLITRGISVLLYNIGLENEVLYGRAGEPKHLHIVEHRKIFYLISAAMIAAGFIAMGAHSAAGEGNMNYSLDFVGGTSTTVTFNEDMSLEQLDQEIATKIEELTGVSSAQVQKVAGTNEVIFKTTTLSVEQRAAVSEMLQEDYGVDPASIAAETISSTISAEMSRDAVVAMIIAMAIMLIYIWIRFRDILFGTSAILALAHDALVVIACYAITRIEVGGTFIACILTIIGYSINDTIVTFDRIRENLQNVSGPKDRVQIINKSISQTLTRSLFTSVTTFFMVLCLFIFGVTDIRYFALPLMVGVVCGTYSSICIASPIWYDFRRRFGR